MFRWPFADAPNTVAITSKQILAGLDWIDYVSHDEDDGAWQFHGHGGPTAESDAAVVGLGTIVELDPTVAAVADLPHGWCAWRDGPGAPWHRKAIADARRQ